jgi:Leucine-rich repeat (LRR) protein
LRDVTNVECLRIRNCKLESIDCDTFFDLKNVKHLHFRSNVFTQQKEWNEIFKCFNSLKNLVELEIRNCNIKSLSNDAFTCFPKLEKLDIGNNSFVNDIQNKTFKFTERQFKKRFLLPKECRVSFIIDDSAKPDYNDEGDSDLVEQPAKQIRTH